MSGNPANLPPGDHRHDSFYTMRADAFDRFGTRIEQRFSRAQIDTMMRRGIAAMLVAWKVPMAVFIWRACAGRLDHAAAAIWRD